MKTIDLGDILENMVKKHRDEQFDNKKTIQIIE
jgi:hypothetical protein